MSDDTDEVSVYPDQRSDGYYIRDKRQVVGNCALWWRANGAGYCCDIDDAGVYSEKEARSICRNRDTDVAYRVQDVQRFTIKHVRFDVQLAPEPVEWT